VNQLGGRCVDLCTGDHGGAMYTGAMTGVRPEPEGLDGRAEPEGETVRTGR
jgi:hypothetical protein